MTTNKKKQETKVSNVSKQSYDPLSIKDINGVEWRSYTKLQDVFGPESEDWYVGKSKGSGQCSLDSLSIAMNWDRDDTYLKDLRMRVAQDPFIQNLMEQTQEQIAKSHCFLNPDSIFHLTRAYNTVPLIINGQYNKEKADVEALACNYLLYHPTQINKDTTFIVIIWVGYSHYQPMGKLLNPGEEISIVQTKFSWNELSANLQHHFRICQRNMNEAQEDLCNPKNIEPCYMCKKPFHLNALKSETVQCQATCIAPNGSQDRCQRPADQNYLTVNEQGVREQKYCWYHFQKEHQEQYDIEQDIRQEYEQLAKKEKKEKTQKRERELKTQEKTQEAFFRFNRCSASNGFKSEFVTTYKTTMEMEKILKLYHTNNKELDDKTNIWYIWDTFTGDPSVLIYFVQFLCRRAQIQDMDMSHPISIPDFTPDCEWRMYRQYLQSKYFNLDAVNQLLQKECNKGNHNELLFVRMHHNNGKIIVYEARFLNCLGVALHIPEKEKVLEYLSTPANAKNVLDIISGIETPPNERWQQFYETYFTCTTGFALK